MGSNGVSRGPPSPLSFSIDLYSVSDVEQILEHIAQFGEYCPPEDEEDEDEDSEPSTPDTIRPRQLPFHDPELPSDPGEIPVVPPSPEYCSVDLYSVEDVQDLKSRGLDFSMPYLNPDPFKINTAPSPHIPLQPLESESPKPEGTIPTIPPSPQIHSIDLFNVSDVNDIKARRLGLDGKAPPSPFKPISIDLHSVADIGASMRSAFSGTPVLPRFSVGDGTSKRSIPNPIPAHTNTQPSPAAESPTACVQFGPLIWPVDYMEQVQSFISSVCQGSGVPRILATQHVQGSPYVHVRFASTGDATRFLTDWNARRPAGYGSDVVRYVADW